MELNNTFFEKPLTVRCLKNTWRLHDQDCQSFRWWSRHLKEPFFLFILSSTGFVIFQSLPERTDSIIWLRDEVMVCLCFCPITWKTIYNLMFPSLNLFSPHLPFVPEPWAFPKGTALCLLPVQKGTAQPLRAPCWVVWGGWLFPMSSQGSPCIPSRTVPQSPLLIWAEILSFIPLGPCHLLFSSQETLHPL